MTFLSELINSTTGHLVLLVIVGIIAGFINVMAGGGSLLTLPILIFTGLPSNVANATNRVAILMQNMLAIQGFRSKGIFIFPYSLWLGVSALAGALIGSSIAVDLNEGVFNKILAAVMVIVVGFLIIPRKKKEAITETLGRKHQVIAIITFFFIGIYGGFIQAGTGYLIMLSISMINGLPLVKTNAIKVFVALIYTIGALGIFIVNGLVNWKLGIALGIGNAIGGWVSSRIQVKIGEKWIRIFLGVSVIAMAIKLWSST